MVTQELINFIKSQLEKGVKRVEIEDQLLKNGWLKADIDSAFNLATAPTTPIESKQIQSIQPEQAQPNVSQPVFEIKPNLTNEPMVQQPDFQFSQYPFQYDYSMEAKPCPQVQKFYHPKNKKFGMQH